MDEMIFTPCSDVVLFSACHGHVCHSHARGSWQLYTEARRGKHRIAKSCRAIWGKPSQKMLAYMHKYFEMDSFK